METPTEFQFDPDPIWRSMRDFKLPSGGVLVRGREIKVPIPIEPPKKVTRRTRKTI